MAGKKKTQKNNTSYVKGQSGNPNGRPPNDVNKRELLAAFNNNYDDLYKIFHKYVKMPAKEFNKHVVKVQKNWGNYTVMESVAIRFISEMHKKKTLSRIDFVNSIVLGTYQGGLKRIPKIEPLELEAHEYSQMLEEFYGSDEHKKLKRYKADDVLRMLLGKGSTLSKQQHDGLKFVASLLGRIEESKQHNVKREVIRDMLMIVDSVLRKTVGRRDVRLLADVSGMLRSELGEAVVELVPSAYRIEPLKRGRGRPVGSKNREVKG